jgi:hypothetical protein
MQAFADLLPWASTISSTLGPSPRRAAFTLRTQLAIENPSRQTTRVLVAVKPLAA